MMCMCKFDREPKVLRTKNTTKRYFLTRLLENPHNEIIVRDIHCASRIASFFPHKQSSKEHLTRVVTTLYAMQIQSKRFWYTCVCDVFLKYLNKKTFNLHRNLIARSSLLYVQQLCVAL